MQAVPDSLERLVPDALTEGDATGRDTLRIHLERYDFASRRARPGRLLDCACGVGYGTRRLVDACPAVSEAIGVDLSEEAVAYARERYAHPKVTFRAADAMALEDAEGFDTIVSLETIEHVPDPEGFVGRLAALLRPGGVLVASVPTTPSVDVNPHHRHDFTPRSFRRMLARCGLREVDHLLQVQPVPLGAVVGRSEVRLRDRRENLPAWYARHPGAALRRLWSTLRHGFANHYLTLACERGPAGADAR